MEIPHFLLALSGAAVFLVSRAIYRLYFHPLSKIPGPKLAAVTHLYEFYYDVWCSGRYLFEIGKMHRQYGPIVRITPREVHVLDPDFYEEIYASSSRRREKDPKFVPVFSVSKSMIATVSHEHHRLRRNILNTFFSKRSVLELTPMIQERVQQLLRRFQESYHAGSVVKADDAFAALSADIVTYYCYGRLWGFLEDENFRSDIRKASSELSSMVHLNRFFPFLAPLGMKAPVWLVNLLSPGTATLFEFQRSIMDTVHSDPAKQSGKTTRTIAQKLRDPTLPPEERSISRQEEESLIVLAAGTETTGRVLSLAAYYIYQDSVVLRRLRTELKDVLPAPTSTCALSELEKLPYLTAVISESLRLATPVISRSPRVAPDETLAYKNYFIPPGTPIGSSSLFVHLNPTIFPNPKQFNPDRWLQAKNDVTGGRLNHYLTSFNKGSRACIGINLAYAEMYMALAYLVRRIDLEIDSTHPENMEIRRDFFVGYTEHDEPRVRARVTGILEH
ncbi:cytochrome P450 [Aspergillus granulosus]|uniref:Cytochrome P450 n=1 Tax=Aspergillus granulosus TaxID=176169 RepID=A0ABR4H684_9EURO